MPSSGRLPSRPTRTAPADLRPGESERLRDWIAGTCLAARDLDALTGGCGDDGAALSIGTAIARLRAVTVSRRSDGLEQELLADELLRLCLRYPADIALAALEQGKAAGKFFPAYAELLAMLEALLQPRRAWLQAVEGWPQQVAEGRHRTALAERRLRALRILERLASRRRTGRWLPCDQAEWARQSAALAGLERRLAALETSRSDEHETP